MPADPAFAASRSTSSRASSSSSSSTCRLPATAPLLLPLLLAALTLAACGKEQAPAAARTPEVAYVTLRHQPVALSTELPGRTVAYRVAEVRPQVDGIILKRLFKEGSEVRQGQQLYQIDPSIYQAAHASASATLESARQTAQRYERLARDRAVSQQEYEQARAAWLTAQAAVDRAAIDLRYTRVLAPISGRIGRSFASEGALATNGQANALATVQQLDPIYVDVTQPSSALLGLRRDLAAGRLEAAGDNAARVRLILEDGSEYAEPGRLEFTEVGVDTGTGSVTLRAVFPNPRHELLPGMFVRARMQQGVRPAAMLAPQRGVTRDAKGQATALLVNQNDEVELRRIEAERVIGDNWLVSGGLQPGERLIVEGLQFVRPGMKVRPLPLTAVAPADTANTANASSAASAVVSQR
ncbi:efflux RND transporter periplasmic adaptor subunit [Cupriavidus gilardii]|nr:efflux RND transporter periplasmic adaptor subunit [Cupriavidus gilardii]